ncbi:hypothetical protein C8Q79DRAFT_925855 [Trametes meyenii]|nr:hypothetical protein C8Q79DRAFT_925855 [Trametes meyenii]
MCFTRKVRVGITSAKKRYANNLSQLEKCGSKPIAQKNHDAMHAEKKPVNSRHTVRILKFSDGQSNRKHFNMLLLTRRHDVEPSLKMKYVHKPWSTQTHDSERFSRMMHAVAPPSMSKHVNGPLSKTRRDVGPLSRTRRGVGLLSRTTHINGPLSKKRRDVRKRRVCKPRSTNKHATLEDEARRRAAFEDEARRRVALENDAHQQAALEDEDAMEEDFVQDHLQESQDDDTVAVVPTSTVPSCDASEPESLPSPEHNSRSLSPSFMLDDTIFPTSSEPSTPTPFTFKTSGSSPATMVSSPSLDPSLPPKPDPTNGYRVPSPTFDQATSSSPPKETASAQFMALLLRQNERMTQLMQTLVVQNQELQSVLTGQLTDLTTRLDTFHAESAKSAKNNDEDEDTNGDGHEVGDEGNDEMAQEELQVRPRKKRQKASILNDANYKDGLRALQACVRKHLLTLCNAESMKELVKKNPPITDDEMDSFLEGEDDMLTCTVQSFRVDFERPWKDNAFNRHADHVFARSLIKMYKGGNYSDHTVPDALLTELIISTVLEKHMEYRRKLYRQHLKPLKQEQLDKIKQRKAMNAHRSTLRDSCVFTILQFKLNQHKCLFSMLRPIHMSGDETDGDKKVHPPRFRIVEARWQSLALKIFFRTLNMLYRECWATPVGERATCGNPPRVRVEHKDARVEDSLAPIGLWRNCYDRAWLESLRPHMRKSLQIIDSDYDFKLPAPKPVSRK